QQRIERVMNVTVGREMDRIERFMSFLATVGSTAPFVGLFGTVWGIMDSFQSIAASKNTSLAVVAPGIADSLFATALGLVGAILVLLVVFMVTAPLLTVGVPVELPQTQAPPINEPKEPLVITVNRDGAIFIQETTVPVESLIVRLQSITGSNPDAVLYVRGDKEIN